MFSWLKHTKKLQDHEDRLTQVERDSKQMRLEWEDTYDKLKTIVQRIVKRAQRIEQLSPEGAPAGEEPENLPPGGASQLNPRQSLINQKILARRRMNGVQ